MGASDWDYVVDLPADAPVDLVSALARLRERVLAEGDFYWGEEDYLGPRPTTLAELDELRETEEFWEVGTHSVLDVDTVIGSGEPEREGTIRPLTPPQAQQLFGTATPGRTEFAAADVHDSVDDRWTGQCQVLYDGEQPVAVGFWGISGD